MGLSKDIENTFLKTMGYDMMEDKDAKKAIKKSAKTLGVDLSKSIIDFLQKQEFNITEMKAIVKLDKLTTTGNIKANIEPTVQALIPIGSVVLPSLTPNPVPIPANISSLTGLNGVTIPKLKLTSKPGKLLPSRTGGNMNAIGYAYVGVKNPVGPNESNENKTKVKLINVKEG